MLKPSSELSADRVGNSKCNRSRNAFRLMFLEISTRTGIDELLTGKYNGLCAVTRNKVPVDMSSCTWDMVWI